MREYQYVAPPKPASILAAVNVTCDICGVDIGGVAGMASYQRPVAYSGLALDGQLTDDATHAGEILHVCAEWCEDCSDEMLEHATQLALAKDLGLPGYHVGMGREPWRVWMQEAERSV